MDALKRKILFHLEALANLNNYSFIMIDIIINSLIIFSCNHFCPFKSFFLS